MRHTLTNVDDCRYEGDYSMWIRFTDGFCTVIDFSPVLKGPLFGPLIDQTIFSKGELDTSTGTIVWPNGADFDPDTLYNWTEMVDELSQRINKV